jgi:hypothetical protein
LDGTHLIQLIKLHRNRHYLSISHILKQNLWITDYKRIGDVEWVPCYFIVNIIILAIHTLVRTINNISNSTHMWLSDLRLHRNVVMQLIWWIIINTRIGSHVLLGYFVSLTSSTLRVYKSIWGWNLFVLN